MLSVPLLLVWEPTRIWTCIALLAIIVYWSIKFRSKPPIQPVKATDHQIEKIDSLSAGLYLDFEESLLEILGEVRLPSQMTSDEADEVIRGLEQLINERDSHSVT